MNPSVKLRILWKSTGGTTISLSFFLSSRTLMRNNVLTDRKCLILVNTYDQLVETFKFCWILPFQFRQKYNEPLFRVSIRLQFEFFKPLNEICEYLALAYFKGICLRFYFIPRFYQRLEISLSFLHSTKHSDKQIIWLFW